MKETVPNPWQDWLKQTEEQQKASYLADLPERITNMHKMYGRGPEEATCSACRFFVRLRRGNTYFKCRLNKMTHGAATDWRASWPACGKFETPKNVGASNE